jgi:hypothetical protein
MKKIAIAFVAVVTLAACAPATTSTPTVTVTQTQAAPAPVETQTLDQKVVEVARLQGNSYIANISDSEILSLTHQVCPILDQGVSMKELVVSLATGLARDGVTDPEAMRAVGIILGVAVAAYCPQYESQVQSL